MQTMLSIKTKSVNQSLTEEVKIQQQMNELFDEILSQDKESGNFSGGDKIGKYRKSMDKNREQLHEKSFPKSRRKMAKSRKIGI